MEPQHAPRVQKRRNIYNSHQCLGSILVFGGVYIHNRKILQLVEWCTWIWFGLYIISLNKRSHEEMILWKLSKWALCSVEENTCSFKSSRRPKSLHVSIVWIRDFTSRDRGNPPKMVRTYERKPSKMNQDDLNLGGWDTLSSTMKVENGR